MLPLIDRPFLQHIVEFVVEAGVDTIDIVLSHLPEKVEALLGDCTRWGVQIRYHLARDAARPYAALSRFGATGPVLLVHADCLPHAALNCASLLPAAFYSGGTWTGWAILDSATTSRVETEWDRPQLARFVMDAAGRSGSFPDCPAVLGVHTEAEFIASQRAALEKRIPDLMFSGREVQEGIWIARNVTLHPTATLIPPVYLGENSRIGAGIRLGPNVVVVRDCVLDSGTTVADSAILPGSYVGQALELDHVIVDRNRLANVHVGGEIVVRDDFILSGINRGTFRSVWTGLLSRIAALVLFAFTFPVLLLTALGLRLFRKGPVVRPVTVLCLPAGETQWEWKTFDLNTFSSPDSNQSAIKHLFLRFLPGLIHVIRGQIHLVGVEPRSPDEVAALPGDWRTLYLRARAGLVTEAFTLHGAGASADEVYASEAYYSVAAGPLHDASVLLRFLGRILQPRQVEHNSGLSANLDLK